MSAANAIIKPFPGLLAAGALALLILVSAGHAATNGAPGGSLAGQLDKMTEKEGPRSSPSSDRPSGSGISELKVLGIISADEQGKKLLLPSDVFCDQAADEAYVVDNGHITVYGDNFFPIATIGEGRGLITATGVYVDKEGNVYVPQAPYYDQPARISVYNAAFLPVRHLDLNNIPGAESGVPKSLVISDTGLIYVAFDPGIRGLLVLDGEGKFLRWLRPLDLIYDKQAILTAKESSEQEEEGAEAKEEKPDFDVSELVPALVPEDGEQVFATADEPGIGPVQVNDVQRDEIGNLYLLSTETSKVYIYNDTEEYLYNFGEKGGTTGKLSQPRQLVVDNKKKAIYIADYMRHAILIYDLSGRFMHEFGGKGNRPGWFQYPRSLATNTKGELMVADMFNRRVQVLDVQFEYKFPLFQVPFVYEQGEGLQPRPIQATSERYFGPGFSPGEQALLQGPEEIRSLLQQGDDLM